jgi:hypothetical protein
MSAEPDTKKTQRAKNPWIYVLGIIAAGFVVLGFTLPFFPDSAARHLLTRELNNLKQVALVFRMYSSDEGGAPKTLAELWATEKYVGKDGWRQIGKFRRPITHTQLDWLYFPERIPKNKSDEPTLVFASPEPWKGERVVGWSDTSCQIISEAEFTAIQARGGRREPKK